MYKELSNIKRWLILFNVALSVFMATLDGSIVNIALPVISKELSVNINSIQWVVTSYLLTISLLLLIWGRISDMYGKKGIFAAGFIIFTVGSAMCGLSSSLHFLVVSRIIQAIGASSLMALSQGIVTSTFPSSERGKSLGIIGATVAIGSLVGPSLGGILVHASGWQSIFLINIPIGILGTILTFILIPEIKTNPASSRFDFIGSILFVIFLTFLFMSLLLFQEGNINPALLTVLITISIISFIAFIRYEKTVLNPLIELSLFNNRVFTLGLFSAFLSFVAIFSSNLFLPFYLQNVQRLETLNAGILMSFYPIATFIVAPISGWLSDKISYKPLTVTGLLISTLSLIGLSTLTQSSSHILFVILMLFLGTGTAVFQSPNNSSVMGSVSHNQLGIAGGINALFRNLGMVTGITFSVILFSLTTRMNINNLSGETGAFDTGIFLKGFRYVLTAAACISFTGAMLSLVRVVKKR